jgi:hypothetical protein
MTYEGAVSLQSSFGTWSGRVGRAPCQTQTAAALAGIEKYVDKQRLETLAKP